MTDLPPRAGSGEYCTLDSFVHFSTTYTYRLLIGSIARCARRPPVFSLLRGRFWGFSPRRGDALHRWGWN